jgi:hypothetical protein
MYDFGTVEFCWREHSCEKGRLRMNQPSTSQAGASPRLRGYAIAAVFVAASVLIRFALAPWF